MSESRPSTPEEFPLVVTLLRENIQDLHQDIRDLRSELKQDIQDVRNELHSRALPPTKPFTLASASAKSL